MSPRRPRIGWLASAIAGMGAKEWVGLGVGVALMAGQMRTGERVGRAEDHAAKADTAAAAARWRGGHLRATVDTLRRELAAEKEERRREARAFQRQLARLQSRPAVAPEFHRATETAPADPADDDEEDGLIGPPEPAVNSSGGPGGVRGLIAKPFKALGRLFGGG